ncbi:hypothetical protein B0H19DRAFT_1076383 [Mycena capillaripes]|nr:hypothetical protein B0H19DRAFT_1076383 [Mycena capillaripes]
MAAMACSRALQITEIARMICDEADPEWWGSPPKTLLALARTSKIFTERALDLIWREQRSLVPLVKCMPETLWEERGTGFSLVIHLRRPITFDDMPRLLFYSVRVRELQIQAVSLYGSVHAEFLKALDMALPPQVFMPRLSHFSWYQKKKAHLSLMHHFLGPQTRKITLELGNEMAGLSILPYIQSSCPRVSEFSFDVAADAVSIRSISSVVCGWHHLTDLSVPNLDKAGFIHVAGLNSLTSLSLSDAKTTALLHPPEFLSGPTFPVLENLFVCCETARFCGGVIQVISSRRLRRLSVQQMTSWTTSAWQELHTTFRDCLDNTTLTSIDVEEPENSDRVVDTTSYVLSADALRPLLAFKNLHGITYQLIPCLDVDDDFLEEMALAWPRLDVLQFGSEVLIREQPRATLKCLVAFARHCPNLTLLGIRMDASHVPNFTQVPRQRISNSLDTLDVGTSTINSDTEARVAAFVSNLFPELESLSWFSSPSLPESHSTSWRRVSNMVPVFCEMRSQEEKFWTEELGNGEESEDLEELFGSEAGLVGMEEIS